MADPVDPDALPPPQRLALAYAPRGARPPWHGLLALDWRLEQVLRGAREPLLAQIKLAWWRERFAEPAASWPSGEPLLALLRCWDGEREALARLVEGWEGLVGGDPQSEAVDALIHARGGAVEALARLVGCGDSGEKARAAAQEWAAADLSERLGIAHAAKRVQLNLAVPRLPRELRPLAVLSAAARPSSHGFAGVARILRVGMFGR